MAARPKSPITKNNQYRLRMTDEELDNLEFCCKEMNQTKAEVIRLGISMVYDKIQKQK